MRCSNDITRRRGRLGLQHTHTCNLVPTCNLAAFDLPSPNLFPSQTRGNGRARTPTDTGESASRRESGKKRIASASCWCLRARSNQEILGRWTRGRGRGRGRGARGRGRHGSGGRGGPQQKEIAQVQGQVPARTRDPASHRDVGTVVRSLVSWRAEPPIFVADCSAGAHRSLCVPGSWFGI